MVEISTPHAPLDFGRREFLRGGAAMVVGLLLGAPIDLRGIVTPSSALASNLPGEPGRPVTAPAGLAATAEASAARLPRSLVLLQHAHP